MTNERDLIALATWFDGEGPLSDELAARLETDNELQDFLHDLRAMRSGAEVAAATPEISDQQFNAFMDGVHEGIAVAPRGARNWWAMASMVAASLLISLSIFYIFTGPEPVQAHEVQSVATELSGATTDYYDTDEGLTTIWVTVAQDDL